MQTTRLLRMQRLVALALLLLSAPLSSIPIGPVRASWAIGLVAASSSQSSQAPPPPSSGSPTGNSNQMMISNRAQQQRPDGQLSVSLDTTSFGSSGGLGGSLGLSGGGGGGGGGGGNLASLSLNSNQGGATGEISGNPPFAGFLQTDGGGSLAGSGGSSLPSNMLAFGLNPVGSTAKYLLPSAYKGLNEDLNNNYMQLANGASKGYNQLSSQFSALGDSALNRYHSMMQQNTGSLTRYLSNDEITRRLYDMVSNPQQMCHQLASQTQNLGLQNVQQQQQQQQQPTSSMFNKLGSFSFGKK